jgi:hypothetical protein
MRATDQFGQLVDINNCHVEVPGFDPIVFNIMPDITDSKGASYNDEVIMGRSFPVKTYSHSENRTITIDMHFIALSSSDIEQNMNSLRILQSATYPRDGDGTAPYLPPPICSLTCGRLLGNDPLCAILKTYSVKFPTDVPLDPDTLLPYKFDVSTTWEAVYSSRNLPGQSKIAQDGD